MTELATSLEATEQDRLEQAEALVRSFCGWHIAPSRTETLTVRARGGNTLLLPSMYVTAITTVTMDDTSVLTVEDQYIWSAAGVLTHGNCWGYGVVEVALTHGYTDAPAEVTAVVQAVAQRAVSNPSGASSRSIGPFSESYGSLSSGTALSLFDSEKEVLRRYRIPAVA